MTKSLLFMYVVDHFSTRRLVNTFFPALPKQYRVVPEIANTIH